MRKGPSTGVILVTVMLIIGQFWVHARSRDEVLIYLGTHWNVSSEVLEKHYFVTPRKVTFFQCHNTCRRHQYLGKSMESAAFNSLSEQNVLGHLIYSANYKGGLDGNLHLEDFWTGLNSLDNLLVNSPQSISDDAWTWFSTGLSISYSDAWNMGEPNRYPVDQDNSNLQWESCVVMVPPYSSGAKLNDAHCNVKFRCVCQSTIYERIC